LCCFDADDGDGDGDGVNNGGDSDWDVGSCVCDARDVMMGDESGDNGGVDDSDNVNCRLLTSKSEENFLGI